jgi:hypothetical protein
MRSPNHGAWCNCYLLKGIKDAVPWKEVLNSRWTAIWKLSILLRFFEYSLSQIYLVQPPSCGASAVLSTGMEFPAQFWAWQMSMDAW